MRLISYIVGIVAYRCIATDGWVVFIKQQATRRQATGVVHFMIKDEGRLAIYSHAPLSRASPTRRPQCTGC